MSQNAQRDMSGILFKNDRKEQPKHPDYQGSCTIEGTEYWMSAWIKDGNRGKFMSFAFKPKEQSEKKPPKQTERAELDDEIPF